MVFDCTARYKGTSLNDQPLSGPDLINSLLGVLLRFRQEPVSLSSDIETMFHQVMVDPNGIDTLRFIWWPEYDLSKEHVDYTFLVASLYQVGTILVFERRPKTMQETNNKVIDTVLKNFHVDDCLKSV